MGLLTEPDQRSGGIQIFSTFYFRDINATSIGDGTLLRRHANFLNVLSMEAISNPSTSNEHSTRAWRSQQIHKESASI